MEDIYANIYVLKCWREAERVTSLISLIFCLCVEMCIHVPPIDIIKTSIVCMHQFNCLHCYLKHFESQQQQSNIFYFIIKTKNINGCFTASYPL